MRPPKIHNLGPNAKEDSPHLVVVIDTETRSTTTDAGELHTLRLWCGKAVYRHGHSPTRPRVQQAHGQTAGEMAAWLTGLSRERPPMWVYAHNLSFDLAVTQLPLELLAAGWTMSSHNLASDAPWAVLRSGRRTLRLADSHSLMPEPLVAIGAKIGVAKPPLPAQDDSDAAWLVRCRGDVETTMAALLELMDWWDSEQLGHWSITGPRTGFNAMRHRCVKRDGYDPLALVVWGEGEHGQSGDGHVVIDPDPDARVFERATLYQGRRDAWRVGALERGVYVEADMVRAHLTVAARRRLPCRRGKRFTSLEITSPLVHGQNVSIIAEVEIDTEHARYPVRTRYGIVHPVGRFRTVLAGPEIADARDRGELVSIGAGYYYRMSWHMQPWARWAEDVLADRDQVVPAAAKIAVKGWSRSVPGTWAARTSRTLMTGTSPVPGWLAEPVIYGPGREPGVIMHLAGRMEMVLKDQEADDSFPAVLSFIQSYVRLALSRMIDRIPDYRLVCCSTDSLIVDSTGFFPGERVDRRRAKLNAAGREHGADLVAWLAEAADPFTMAVKGTAADVRVLTPQHIRLDGDVRYSGVGRGAVEVERDAFKFLTWPKLGSQIADTAGVGYRRKTRTVDLSQVKVPRFALDCGCTVPGRMAIWDGENVVIGPQYPGCPRHPDACWQLAQHSAMIWQ